MTAAAEIRARLRKMAEPAYQKFSSALIPGCDNMLGVRLPALRKMAKNLCEEAAAAFIEEKQEEFFEETMLKGILIATRPMSLTQRLQWTQAFIPRISNWSVCDSFCTSFRPKPQERDRLWRFLSDYAGASEEFAVRFAAVMAMDHYLTEQDLPRTLVLCSAANTEAGNYARMGVAWTVSMAYVRCPEKTLPLLRDGVPDAKTAALAIKKICESRKTDEAQKCFLKTLKRTRKGEP